MHHLVSPRCSQVQVWWSTGFLYPTCLSVEQIGPLWIQWFRWTNAWSSSHPWTRKLLKALHISGTSQMKTNVCFFQCQLILVLSWKLNQGFNPTADVYPSHSQNYEVLEEAASMAAPKGLRSENFGSYFQHGLFWYFMYAVGDDGMKQGKCINRGGSSVMSDTTRALIVQNFFPNNPNPIDVCVDNSDALWNELSSCYSASGNRWSNFLAVDFYKVIIIHLTQFQECVRWWP